MVSATGDACTPHFALRNTLRQARQLNHRMVRWSRPHASPQRCNDSISTRSPSGDPCNPGDNRLCEQNPLDDPCATSVTSAMTSVSFWRAVP